MDGRLRPARIAEVIRQLDADIIALQEVLSMEGEEGSLDQARFFANELGLHCAMGENRRLRGGGYGNVVLSRFPVRSSRNYDVSVPGRERRGCLRTDLELTNGQIIHLFNVHLGTAFLERRHQARKLLEEELLRSRNVEGPRVVLGDFNEWTKGLVTQMLKAEFQSADLRLHLQRTRTYPGFLPFMHLDHIYYDKALVLDAIHLHRTPMAMVASDHLPLVAEFAVF
jgi:endonuclease/exonuclease/phosphatase family metal-dependent hydrolase